MYVMYIAVLSVIKVYSIKYLFTGPRGRMCAMGGADLLGHPQAKNI